MSASPAISPLPGATTVPEAGSAPPDGAVPDAGAQEPPAGRRRKVLLLALLVALLGGLVLLALWYLLFRQPLPLPGIPENQLPAFSYSVYGVDRPMGIAVTATGDRIYVTETEGERVVRIFDHDGNPQGTMRPPGTDSASSIPIGVAIDPLSGEVYVSDRLIGAVFVYAADGTYLREFRPEAVAAGWQPLALAFDAQGLLYASDLSGTAQKVVVFDRTGGIVRTLGEGEGLSFPNGLSVDANGNVYVTDSNNGRLLAFDPTGSVVARIGRGIGEGNLGLPRGLAIDRDGRMFVVDSSGQGLFVYRAVHEGEDRPAYLGFFGAHGVDNGEFRYPNGVAVDGRGRIYVSDSGNDRLNVWSY